MLVGTLTSPCSEQDLNSLCDSVEEELVFAAVSRIGFRVWRQMDPIALFLPSGGAPSRGGSAKLPVVVVCARL